MAMKKCMKEVWVKFDSQDDYLENEKKLFAILDKALGDSIVKVYDASTRECKTLKGHSFDDKQFSLLVDFLGEDNAKYQEREIEVQQPKPMKVPKVLQIIPCNDAMYAVYNCDGGKKYKSKVLMYALCDDGEIYPLCFDNWLGVCSLVEAVYDVVGYELEGGEIWQDGGKLDEQ